MLTTWKTVTFVLAKTRFGIEAAEGAATYTAARVRYHYYMTANGLSAEHLRSKAAEPGRYRILAN